MRSAPNRFWAEVQRISFVHLCCCFLFYTGVRDARQQIDDFAEKILPYFGGEDDFAENIPDLSSLARSTWKIALVAVPLIGSVLILITTVVKNFLSPTQVLFGAVVNLVTSTLGEFPLLYT